MKRMRDCHGDLLHFADRVRVVAYGFGARLDDAGKRGTVTRIGRSRVTVRLAHTVSPDGRLIPIPPEYRAIAPSCLRRVDA